MEAGRVKRLHCEALKGRAAEEDAKVLAASRSRKWAEPLFPPCPKPLCKRRPFEVRQTASDGKHDQDFCLCGKASRSKSRVGLFVYSGEQQTAQGPPPEEPKEEEEELFAVIRLFKEIVRTNFPPGAADDLQRAGRPSEAQRAFLR